MKNKHYKQITPREAFRAMYIDFEGFKKGSPSLIGIACEYEFEQVVLSERLYPAAEAKGLKGASLERMGQELLGRSDDEDRLIVGYSQLERKLLRKYGQVDVQHRYRDARMIGRRWINRVRRRRIVHFSLRSRLFDLPMVDLSARVLFSIGDLSYPDQDPYPGPVDAAGVRQMAGTSHRLKT
ncbi:MAG: hypothetical protein R6U63_08215 [Longimicrobiales bacterium]